MELKKLRIIFYSIILNICLVVTANAQADKECFEKVSRGVFKFNQGFDNLILEPAAKFITNFLNQLEMVLGILL